jgi:two-component system cell cycle response regulator
MGARILAVEDTPHSLQLMTYLLTAHGHTVVGASTGEEGLKLLPGTRPDLIVLDLQLPGIDGFEVLRRIRSGQQWRDVTVVAVTALAMVGDRDRALAAGFDGYVTKPIDPEVFALKIDEGLPPELRGHSREVQSEVGSAPEPGPAAPSDPAKGGATILAVDDIPNNLELIRSVLEPNGYRVDTASTIEGALELSLAEPPDLVLSDVHLGADHGRDLLARLRASPELRDVPFVYVTATADPEDIMLDGHTEVIQRPIEPERLVAAVDRLIHVGAR